MKQLHLLMLMVLFMSLGVYAQQTLPFPPVPSASTAGPTMQESIYKSHVEPNRLPEKAPNILIILIDDVGPGTPDTYGGEIHTPNLTRVANAGISYNRFHSTAMCSPTRASLITGRNHTRVGNGQIAELANDWDGFSGTIPKSSATIAEVLKNYGYNTGAWGKWHNSPAAQTTSKGPFEYWPTGYGFEYFYGFLAGEASQYEPSLVRNTTVVETPEKLDDGSPYHLTGDIADDAILWLREQEAFAPDKPFLMYWATGASHGPHHVPVEWADKYKGKFDDGWDAYRERTFKRQKELGWIPQNAILTERNKTMASWKSIPDTEKPFQRRLMEVFAGFTEHADHHAGRILDELEQQGKLDNTLVFYIWGDNGSSSEGQNGSISELLAQNGIATEIQDHLNVLEELGGLEALGTEKTDNMYHAGWAWAGSTPYKSTKLVGAHFGGTRQPLAVSWPAGIKANKTPRPQFHHVVDIAPTVLDILDIEMPQVVNGIPQDPIDGISMRYTFDDAKAEGQRKTQFFDIMGSRGIYQDGWFACTFGPRTPWLPGAPDIAKWDPREDQWELYNLEEDWTQANDLAKKMPKKLADMKELFIIESTKNKNLPIGGGLWVLANPQEKPAPPYKEWTFRGNITRMPEFSSPSLGNTNNILTMDLNLAENANGVLYALGGFSGGLTCYMKDGYINYEYNLFEIERTKLKSKDKLNGGKAKIEVKSSYQWTAKRALEGKIQILVNGKEVLSGTIPRCAPLIFTANDCLDFGSDLGSPVSQEYFEEKPYPLEGELQITTVKYQ
ncbi:arylsulfatase [Reichenbachiella agarivorans]|uniref:Arylsulfatase n=1 Tax=Reichenbachiella agarivorans TaxID=2979464 RepID=A0ABY6CMS7_9BACT|nr:arylsulfatase [Reichenbachiella agarivorans]UXP31782.1 arylsulfatase [Reichenbachiella agarivorans]